MAETRAASVLNYGAMMIPQIQAKINTCFADIALPVRPEREHSASQRLSKPVGVEAKDLREKIKLLAHLEPPHRHPGKADLVRLPAVRLKPLQNQVALIPHFHLGADQPHD